MNSTETSKPKRTLFPWLATLGIFILTAIAMRIEGRVWVCDADSHAGFGGGWWFPWIGDVWTSHCSQHLFDPYSFSHVLHGVVFYGALALVWKKGSIPWKLCISVGIAAAWEILENSPLIINRYRESTMSLDYMGDSILNAEGDILSCLIGFYLTRWLGLWKSVVLFIVMELGMLFWIRDNLTLNVVMLVRPIESIKRWQSEGHAPTTPPTSTTPTTPPFTPDARPNE